MESKFYGPLWLAKHGSPALSAADAITFVSGIAAYRPAARGSVVAAVNAALEGLVRALAIELAPIRVNAVSPGWVNTTIWSLVAGDKKDDMLNAMAKRLPVGRVGEPDDIADAIAFLTGTHSRRGRYCMSREGSAGFTGVKASLAAASNSFSAGGRTRRRCQITAE